MAYIEGRLRRFPRGRGVCGEKRQRAQRAGGFKQRLAYTRFAGREDKESVQPIQVMSSARRSRRGARDRAGESP